MDNPKALPELNEPLDTPEYFADALIGTNWFNGVIKLTFDSQRAYHGPDGPWLYRVSVCRIVVPIAVAEEMISMLTQSVARAKAVPADTVQQVTIN